MIDFPRMVKVAGTKKDGGIAVLSLAERFPAQPGQFAMLWLPGKGEKPYSFLSENEFGIAPVGEFSNALASLKKGDSVGVRGPYGKGFVIKGRRILLIGGGCGIVPLAFLAKEAKEKGISVTSIAGAKTAKSLSLRSPLASCGSVSCCTDDGSAGRKGFVTNALQDALLLKKYDCVYACGPEKMLRLVAEICAKKNVPCQISMERMMKCGLGICGQCDLDGLLVCRDGPVFEGRELLKKPSFGRSRLAPSGKVTAI
ncbi:Sulfhydrogenase 1 subunit gamma [Candidatus Norongarragalina meridionalis]|nr:Sulfhydrogenase 1 subunit gamma [Candidatus Norongarragalina meridionalis]